MRRSVAAIAVLALLWPAVLRSAPGQDEVAAAESAAQADAGTAEGKTYGESLGAAFGRDHGSTIQRCAKEVKRPDPTNFDLFVDETGAVDQVLVRPATNLATCVSARMPGWRIAAPPHAGFWVKVGVTLKR